MAASAATAQMTARCFQTGHNATGANRRNTARTTIAETNPAAVRMAKMMTSCVPRMSATMKAVTTDGTNALLAGAVIK